METIEPTILNELQSLIARAKRILLACHRNPDGDALGSLLGMYFVLREMDKEVTAYCPDCIPSSLAFLPGTDQLTCTIDGVYDATILLDTPVRELFADGFYASGPFVVIDHHKHFEAFGDVVLRKPASAVGEILYYLVRAAGWPLDARAAVCLYTSIVADTSSFKYASATPGAHRAAADLIEHGADPWTVSMNLFESFSVVRRRLLAKVLETLETAADGKFAYMFCTAEMLASAGATSDDLEGMVNAARSVAGVELAALLREENNGSIRVSLRSKGSIDASATAAHFGGGGHVNAAGFRFYGMPMQKALRLLRSHAEAVLGACDELSHIIE